MNLCSHSGHQKYSSIGCAVTIDHVDCNCATNLHRDGLDHYLYPATNPKVNDIKRAEESTDFLE